MRFALACLTAGLAWVAVEVGGGLLFLSLGVRLWRYEILPVVYDITSPIVWGFAAVCIVPLCVPFDRLATARFGARRAVWAHLGFLMVAGPILEVVFNELIFRRILGSPLYRYTVLPTFDGSGSLLSPLYYATLMIHWPVCRWMLKTPRVARAVATFPIVYNARESR